MRKRSVRWAAPVCSSVRRRKKIAISERHTLGSTWVGCLQSSIRDWTRRCQPCVRLCINKSRIKERETGSTRRGASILIVNVREMSPSTAFRYPLLTALHSRESQQMLKYFLLISYKYSTCSRRTTTKGMQNFTQMPIRKMKK